MAEFKYRKHDKIKLTDYNVYSDYARHEGQTAVVTAVTPSRVEIQWADGDTSSLHADESWAGAYLFDSRAEKIFNKLRKEVENETKTLE